MQGRGVDATAEFLEPGVSHQMGGRIGMAVCMLAQTGDPMA